jgi:hypothetical protein
MALAALLVAGFPGSGWAQRGTPLLKTDLIALLSNPVIPPREVAALVRRNCLAFRPTARDLASIRRLGASSDVVASVSECATRRLSKPVTPPVAAAPAPPSLQIVLRQPRLVVAAGAEARTVVLAARGGIPQLGVALALRGTATIDGSPGRDVVATTDDSGFAAFAFPVGRRLGRYHLEVAPASGGELPGRPVIELIVRPGPPASAKVVPGEVMFDQGLDSIARVEVAVRDSIGYPVAGEPVVLGGNAEGRGFRPDTARTDSLGRARLVVAWGGVRRGGMLQVQIGGRQMAWVEVMVGAPLLEAGTGFLSATTLRGEVGNTLAEPLVFEARTRLGQPAVGRVVSFRAVNATVSPATTTTDSVGLASLEVTLGDRVGPAVIVATIDSLQKVVTLQAEPGPVAALVLEHKGTRVDGGALVIGVDTTFILRVRARDTHGNTTSIPTLARMLRETLVSAKFQVVRLLRVEEEPSAVALTFKAIQPGRATVKLHTFDISASVWVDVERLR